MSMRALVAVALLAAVSGGCSLAGRTLGAYVDDKAVTGSVKVALVRSDLRTLTRVNVDTFGGTVYLSGEVDTAQQKSDAEIAAWRVAGVEQVVNDLRVRDEGAVSASPRTEPATAFQERLPGVARVDRAAAGEAALAYDREGTVVATVYLRPLRELGTRALEGLGTTARPITHVALYPVPAGGAQPEALVTIVLWHVSPAAAAALK
jgi:hypothetical protein